MNIIVVGAGWRVVNEVLPALFALGVEPRQIIIVRRNPQPVLGYPNIEFFTSANELSSEQVTGSILLCCIPAQEVFDTLSGVLRIGAPSSVLVDTPISSIQVELKALQWAFRTRICVLEDSILIPWLRALRTANPAFVCFIRGLRNYHGTALLAQLTDRRLVRITPWPLTLFLPWVFVDSQFRLFVIWGRRNAPRAKAYVLTRGGSLIRDTDFLALNESGTISHLTASNQKLLGSEYLEAHEHPIKHIDEWKRIGLAAGLHSLISGREGLFPTLEEALIYEQLSSWDQTRRTRLAVIGIAHRIAEAIPGGKLLLFKGVQLVSSIQRFLVK